MELRCDPIIGQWVMVETRNSWTPERYDKENHSLRHKMTCQFCPGKEYQTPPEIEAIRTNGSPANTPGWEVRVVPNKFPALKIEGNLDPRQKGLFELSNGIGAHEVIIETAEHERNLADFSEEEMVKVIWKYQSRLGDLTRDTRFKYIIIFRNYGESAGATVEHAHSQIIALPMVPRYVEEELEGTQRYYHNRQKCVFCDMIEQEQQEKARIVCENDLFIAFCPFVSRYSFEQWILPKQHSSDFALIAGNEQRALARILKEALSRMKICLSDPAYNYYLHVSPVNYKGVKSFHWHIEIVPQLQQTTGFELGTGFYIVRTSPEQAAGYLRAVKYPVYN